MKKGIEIIKELRKTSKGKAILFFGGYLIFFIVVVLFVKFSSRSTTMPSDYEKGNSSRGSDISIDKLVTNNYLFSYKINLDGVEYLYNGKRYKDKELFQYNNETYYKQDDNYFKKNGELWVKTENPYKFNLFLDSSKIISIIEMSSLESKTTYEDGRSSMNLLISTNTINQKFNNIDSDYLEEPNKITLIANKSSDIDEVTYDLSSYCKLNNLCQSNLKITLNYEMYGEIKKIDNPVNE